MNIYSDPGTKVIFANPTYGYPHDQENAKQHLTADKVYTVDHTDVFDSSTDVYLVEVPGVAFNSVLFEDAGPVLEKALRLAGEFIERHLSCPADMTDSCLFRSCDACTDHSAGCWVRYFIEQAARTGLVDSQDPMKLRHEVAWFAEQMERQLRAHDAAKGEHGWNHLSLLDLRGFLREETDELDAALHGSPGGCLAVVHEAADVANIVMMIADNVRRRDSEDGESHVR